jgi:hypothetical protein
MGDINDGHDGVAAGATIPGFPSLTLHFFLLHVQI